MPVRSTFVGVCASSALLVLSASPARAQEAIRPIPSLPASSVSPVGTTSQAAPLPSRFTLPRDTFAPDSPLTDRAPNLADDDRSLVPSFGRIFTQTVRDFTHLPSVQNALILGIGAGLAGASHPSDGNLTKEMAENPHHTAFFRPGATIGQTYVQMGAGFAAYAIGRASGQSKIAMVGADIVRAQFLTEGTAQVMKLMAGRTRPDGSNSSSFPSGHTASAFATATVLREHFGWKVGIPAYAMATYVGASRIQMQKHYLSDVAFGAALGIVAGRTVTVGIGGSKFALAPIASPTGGMGLGLTKLQK